MFRFKKRASPQQPQQIQQQPQQTPPPPWGAATWTLFHVIAQKVMESKFAQHREDLFFLVRIICQNLPCPKCTEHAKEYLSKIRFDQIKTKTQFQDFFYIFHNSVNIRRKVTTPDRTILETYQSMNLLQVVSTFLYHFNDKSHNMKLMANDFQRKLAIGEIVDWFNKNHTIFDK